MAILRTKEYASKADVFKNGGMTRLVKGTLNKTADVADDDIMLLQKINPQSLVTAIPVVTSGITGMTDVDMVLCQADGTLIKDNADSPATVYLFDGVDMSSAIAGVDQLDSGLSLDLTKSILDLTGKPMAELPADDVWLGLVINTAGSGTGTVKFRVETTLAPLV